MQPALPPAALSGVKTLIVDDNALNRRILEDMLRRWGMETGSVADGPAALRLLESERVSGRPFELILLDAHMPEMDGFALAAAIQETPGSAASIMMLTSVDLAVEADHCRKIGIQRYLVKPAMKSDLQASILQLLGARTSRGGRKSPATASPSPTPALRILLAEDNPVNERLAVRLLQKEGHIVSTAHNGLEVLGKVGQEGFDVILMDVQMPAMDGIQCTRTIRAKADASQHIPIIAMTAHAMQGDMEMCLDAGMDGYLSKPIARDKLYETLARIGRDGRYSPPAPVDVTPAGARC